MGNYYNYNHGNHVNLASNNRIVIVIINFFFFFLIFLHTYVHTDNISFPTNSVTVNEEGSPESVCVDIQGLDSSGIPPMLRIPLSITILNTSAVGTHT